ncbi:MAG: metallophosphoesterase [Bacteroidales bacterium]|nr:metallophosphoesterase [Bacteroidales bacterium]
MTGGFNKVVKQLFFLFLLMVCLSCCTKSDLEQSNEDWSFIVYGDVQQGYGIYGQLAKHIGNINPAPKLAICCGDIMLRSANEAEWINFWQTSKPITEKMPLLLARGNHEGNDDTSEAMLREQFHFANNNFYHARQFENTYFVILDTEKRDEEGSIGDEQFIWLLTLLEDLKQNQSVDHIFLFMHRPVFPQGQHANSPLSNSNELHQLFLDHPKIRAVFSGHEHMFNKNQKDGLMYIITGGGGGILYRGYGGDYHHFIKVSFYENKNRTNIKTIGIFNEVVEDFDL